MLKIRPSVLATLALAALLVPVVAGADGVATTSQDRCTTYRIAAGDSPELRVSNAHGLLQVTKRGRRVRVWHDGQRVADERLRREGPILRVLDDDGRTLYMVGIFGGYGSSGQLAYTPDLDPWSLTGRFGLETDEPDEELAAHLGVERHRTLAVTEVCEGRPAARAGLLESDLIVAVDGHRFDDAGKMVQAAASAPADEAVELEIVRRGERDRVSVVADPVAEWPSAGELESYLRHVVND